MDAQIKDTAEIKSDATVKNIEPKKPDEVESVKELLKTPTEPKKARKQVGKPRGKAAAIKAKEEEKEQVRAIARQALPMGYDSLANVLLSRVPDAKLRQKMQLKENEKAQLTEATILVLEKYDAINLSSIPEIALGVAVLSITAVRLNMLKEYNLEQSKKIQVVNTDKPTANRPNSIKPDRN